MIPIKDIKGAKEVMPKKRKSSTNDETKAFNDPFADGWNACLEQLYQTKVGLDEEALRLELISLIAQLVCDWEMRPRFGKGSSRSDLICNLAKDICQNADKIVRLSK